MYRFFDITLSCDFPLSGLVEAGQGEPDIRVMSGGEGSLENKPLDKLFEWKTPAGETAIVFSGDGDNYSIDYLGMARFHIGSNGRVIDIERKPGLPDDTAGHLLLDHALPRVLSLSGRILIHASAVVTQGGEAIAFVGPSGHGKSTLAASFYRAGFGLLTDDCLQLDPRNDQVFALSAYPSLRLWSASANALFPDFMDFRSVAHYSSKQQVLLAGDDGSVAQPTPLKAVFVLEDPENVGGSERVRIEPLGGTLAAKAMIDSTFVLDNKDRGRVERMFTQMLFIVRTGLPYYRLAYPRVYEQLDAVQSAVLDVIEG